jgi:hypothetical protein
MQPALPARARGCQPERCRRTYHKHNQNANARTMRNLFSFSGFSEKMKDRTDIVLAEKFIHFIDDVYSQFRFW